MAELPAGFNIVPMTEADQDVPVPTNMPEGYDTVQEPDIAPDSFLGRVGEKLGKRVEKVERGTKMYEKGEITYPELAMRGFGFGVGSLFDVVGEGALTILSELTPDAAEDWIKEQISAGGGSLMNTETAQQLLEFYTGLDQRTKDNLGDFLNLALAAVPGGQVGKKVSASGIKGEKRQLAKSVLPQTAGAKQARLAEEGMPKPLQTVTNSEDQILSTVLTIPGVSGSTGRKDLLGALNKELGRLNKQIKNGLAGVKQRVPAGVVGLEVNKSLQEFFKRSPEFTTKKFQPQISQVMDAYRVAMKKHTGTPQSLLDARKEFDSVVEKMLRKDVHAGDDAIKEVVNVIRNKMNTMVSDLAPNANVKALLRRQHHALIARGNVSYNLAREPSWVQGAINTVSSHPFVTTGVLTGTGIGSKVMGSELLGVGLATGAGAYGLSQPVVRRVAGEAMQTLPVTRGMLYGTAQAQQEEQ
jgi:hypothetical protein